MPQRVHAKRPGYGMPFIRGEDGRQPLLAADEEDGIETALRQARSAEASGHGTA